MYNENREARIEDRETQKKGAGARTKDTNQSQRTSKRDKSQEPKSQRDRRTKVESRKSGTQNPGASLPTAAAALAIR